jgi:hypothetical protein
LGNHYPVPADVRNSWAIANNAGKSSVLQALALFFSGSTLSKNHYFDSDRPVHIQVTFNAIDEGDIALLAEEHRVRIRPIVNNGALILVRIYGQDGKSVLRYRKLLPAEDRFSNSSITELVKGKKPGQAFVEEVVAKFPELADKLTNSMNQGQVKAQIQELADSLPDDQKTMSDVELPTGIDKSISPMLPEPIYIPAVKDLKDDVKTAESTPFGKVIGILLEAIQPHLAAEKSLFEQLNAKLNRVAHPDGTETDNRLAPVKTIEETVERFVQDCFKNVKLRIAIPPPELKAVLSSASIYADDGVVGLIETKGDGLRRAIVFAILRSYVELSKTGVIATEESDGPSTEPRHLLLFEEPELYLHPKAQQILFDALGAFAQRHPVMVTTHSPAFFGPQSTTTFVKMRKSTDATLAAKPFGAALPIDLGDTSVRDQFQIICYENNNIAFFADTVVLVEGDSDYIVLPHLARTINPAWDCGQLPIRFSRIGGKANIGRYRQFFKRFDSRVLLVTDLDFLLGPEFGQLDLPAKVRTQRDQLLVALDKAIDASGGPIEPNAERVKAAHERGDLRARWKTVRSLRAEHAAGNLAWEKVETAIDDFFAWEKYWARRDLLKQCPTVDIREQKYSLLTVLRSHGAFVLEKGTIEDYYPNGINGDGKPAKAQCFCNAVATRDDALALCNDGHQIADGSTTTEFEAIFQGVFM